MIMLIVKPTGYGSRGQLFDGFIDGRLVVHSSQPLLAAIRVLLSEGCNPDARIVMRYEGCKYDALRSTVGKAARLTVSDRNGPPAFGRWKPRKLSAVEPPVRFFGGVAT